MSTAPALPPTGARRPLRPLVLLAAVVLLAHAWLLRAVTLGAGDDTRQAGVRRLEARRIELPAPVPAPVAAPAPAAATPAPSPAPKPPPGRRAEAPAEAPAAPPPPPAEAPPPDAPAVAVADAAPAATEAPASAASAPLAAEVPAEAASAGGGSVPVYATRIPAPALLRYDLKRGGVAVTGSLTWRHDGQRYELGLEGSLFGLTVVEQFSQGGFDSAGLAPLRFADRRRGRDLRAANFQRDAGKITFSGPPVEYPLVGGAQDRLSWLVQLPAIAAAAPQSLADGARISIFVVGSRGEGDVWTFGVVGRETLDLARGATETVHLLREPRREYDSRVEVWLAPALDFWPVRARLATPAAVNETTELTLQDGPMPP